MTARADFESFGQFVERTPFPAARHRVRVGGSVPTTLIDLQHEADESVVPATEDAVLVAFRAADCRISYDLGGGWRDYRATPGEIRVHPPAVAVPFRAEGRRHLLLLAFPPERAAALIDVGGTGRPDPVSPLHDGDLRISDPLIFDLMLRMWREAARTDRPSTLFLDGALQGILAMLLRPASPELPPAGGALSDGRLGRVVDFIEADLAGDLSLVDLAAVACLSPHHFSRAFKRATGCSPYAYVLRRRLERARSLVVATDLPLAAVAVDCGFASQSHMTNVFKAHHGITPGRLRRQR